MPNNIMNGIAYDNGAMTDDWHENSHELCSKRLTVFAPDADSLLLLKIVAKCLIKQM